MYMFTLPYKTKHSAVMFGSLLQNPSKFGLDLSLCFLCRVIQSQSVGDNGHVSEEISNENKLQHIQYHLQNCVLLHLQGINNLLF